MNAARFFVRRDSGEHYHRVPTFVTIGGNRPALIAAETL